MQKINTRLTTRFSRLPLLASVFVGIVALSFVVAVTAFALNSNVPTEKNTSPVSADTPAPTMKSSVTKSITNGATGSAETTATSKTKPTNPAQVPSRPAGTEAVSVKPAAGLSLYVDPTLRQQGRPEAIAGQPLAAWFGGWNANVQADVASLVSRAESAGKVAALVAYNIPVRDCGSYSAGGANSSAAYRSWISSFAAGIGSRTAIVILEPDALPGIDCLSASGQAQRLSDISFAVSVLSKTGAITYLDAGNYSWQPVSVMTKRLQDANVALARGFSVNVSGYGWTNQSVTYGQQLARALGGDKGFVVDTSRNGTGPAPDNQWCNPRGRGLGIKPSTTTGVVSLDAYLWIKTPGESDGTCDRGEPAAGEWWQEIADELIRNAV